MTIINIRGTSGSGKSTLVHRLLSEFPNEPIEKQLSNWKKPKVTVYKVLTQPTPTFVIGRYATKCGGCDSLSYKGSHDDISSLIREYATQGNVIFEGLTVSSTISRWLEISNENPGSFYWVFMNTPEEKCYKRIMARNGGKELKRDAKGLADYQKKHRGCIIQSKKLKDLKENVVSISSYKIGYKKILEILDVEVCEQSI